MAKAKIPQKTVKDFYDYDFDSVDTCPEDCWGDYTHRNFFKKYFYPIARKEMKQLAAKLNAEIIECSLNGFDITTVMKRDGKFVYIHMGDMRDFGGRWYETILVRRMAHEKDWSGMGNHHCSYEELEEQVNWLFERG